MFVSCTLVWYYQINQSINIQFRLGQVAPPQESHPNSFSGKTTSATKKYWPRTPMEEMLIYYLVILYTVLRFLGIILINIISTQQY